MLPKGDLKPRNIVRVGAEGVWLLIDFDASCKLGEPAAQKVTSSVTFPPELAQRELLKEIGEDVGVIVATKQFEMWYFGSLE